MIKKADGRRFDSQILAKPHLHPKKVDGPGPGSYIAPSSIRKNNREHGSYQDSTFGNGREVEKKMGNLKQKFETPGPASYNYMYPEPVYELSKMPGFSFSIDGKDGASMESRIRENPGPGAYNPEITRKQNAKTFNSGPDDKAKPDKDNGIPGPGTYPAEDDDGDEGKDTITNNAAPKWSFGKGNPDDKSMKASSAVPGAGNYDVNVPAHTTKAVVFGTQSKTGYGAAEEHPDNKITKRLIDARDRRKQLKKIDTGVPGPNYNIPGDFDFPDPLNPDSKVGKKKAKFCFGMKTN